jgi:FkbM family methyltransferase
MWTSISYRAERYARLFLEGLEKKRLGRRHGVQIAADVPLFDLEMAETIKAHAPRLSRLVDVGAHEGRFARSILALWPAIEVVCIEPNRACSSQLAMLQGRCAKVIQCAVSEKQGTAVYYRHPNSSMNSIVPVDPHMFAKKWSHYRANDIETELVPVETLDGAMAEVEFEEGRTLLLKLDTQGNELPVLRGAEKTLSQTVICVVEHMFWGGYKQHYTLEDLLAFMTERGFQCVGMMQTLRKDTREIAYADLLFRFG